MHTMTVEYTITIRRPIATELEATTWAEIQAAAMESLIARHEFLPFLEAIRLSWVWDVRPVTDPLVKSPSP